MPKSILQVLINIRVELKVALLEAGLSTMETLQWKHRILQKSWTRLFALMAGQRYIVLILLVISNCFQNSYKL